MRLRKDAITTLAGLALLVGGAAPAFATPVTWEFAGSVTNPNTTPGVVAGTPYTGTVTFEPAGAVDDVADDLTYGLYSVAGSVSVTFNGTTYTNSGGLNIVVLNHSTRDEIQVLFQDQSPTTFTIQVRDFDLTALSSDALPTTLPAFSQWDTYFNNFYTWPNGPGFSSQSMDYLRVQGAGGGTGGAVPEPATIALAGLGAAALSVRRRRGA